MRTALCLLLVIMPVCAQAPTDRDASAFLAFVGRLVELRKAEKDAEGNDVALRKARKALAAHAETLKGREIVWPLVVVKVRAQGKGRCWVGVMDLANACQAIAREKGPPTLAAVAAGLRKLPRIDTALTFDEVLLPEEDAGKLRKGQVVFVRGTVHSVGTTESTRLILGMLLDRTTLAR